MQIRRSRCIAKSFTLSRSTALSATRGTSARTSSCLLYTSSTSKTNAEILDELLTKWEEQGYRFGTVEELFN